MTEARIETCGRQAVTLDVPPRLAHRGVLLPDEARTMGIHIQAGKGSGKSRLMGRGIALHDFKQGVPQVVLDPNGGITDNVLDGLARLPGDHQLSADEQRRLWQRVRYVDMSGKGGYVVPFPLYYRLGQESLNDIASRYLEAIRRLDPELKEAPILGWNALAKLGSRTGMVLAALDCQISEAYGLLNQPKTWQERLQHMAATTPDRGLRTAAEFFAREYLQWQPQERERAKSALETKLDMFTLDETMLAMFGASPPGINWREVVDRRQTVLLDFRHEQNMEQRRFKMLWAFDNFVEFIKHRGRGRHRPVGLIIDEVPALYNFDTQAGADIFASELDELVNQIGRDFRVWLTLAHQEQFQINEKSHKALMTMGTQILGVTSDFESAMTMAQQFFGIDPHRVKRHERVWMAPPPMGWPPVVIDERPVEYTVEEQDRIAADRFQHLGLFQFLVKPAKREGDFTGELIPMTIANLDRGIWNNEELVADLRQRLTKRDGIPTETLLAEIEQRQARLGLGRRLPRGKAGQPVQGVRDYARVDSRYEEDDDDFSSLREAKKAETAGAV